MPVVPHGRQPKVFQIQTSNDCPHATNAGLLCWRRRGSEDNEPNGTPPADTAPNLEASAPPRPPVETYEAPNLPARTPGSSSANQPPRAVLRLKRWDSNDSNEASYHALTDSSVGWIFEHLYDRWGKDLPQNTAMVFLYKGLELHTEDTATSLGIAENEKAVIDTCLVAVCPANLSAQAIVAQRLHLHPPGDKGPCWQITIQHWDTPDKFLRFRVNPTTLLGHELEVANSFWKEQLPEDSHICFKCAGHDDINWLTSAEKLGLSNGATIQLWLHDGVSAGS